MQNFSLNFENKYADLPPQFYTKMPPQNIAKNPWLIHGNAKALKLIGMKARSFEDPAFGEYFSGAKILKNSQPLAMVYSGHQFGVWAGQLGDGRALLLGQVRNSKNELWDIQLKGAGLTPYSRMGDGKAVLRSCIREYLCSEAMNALNIPTTRSLCIIGTGEPVFRETAEPGAIFTRLAQSHIRFGHFEHFYYRKQFDDVKLLADYVIENHFPHIKNSENIYADWFSEIVSRTAKLIASWQAVGFCHGVMNTDNMSILGLTLDYGPFGFMEKFDPNYICNHSDHTGRYSYAAQPSIGLWNLYALAQSLEPVLEWEKAIAILNSYEEVLEKTYKSIMLKKIGLKGKENHKFWLELLKIMVEEQSDYSLTFRYLADSIINPQKWLGLFTNKDKAKDWLEKYHMQISKEGISAEELYKKLNRENPKFTLRNWVAEVAIRAAEDNHDYSMIGNILKIMQSPYEEHPEFERFALPAPDAYSNLCVSCSS